MLCTFFAYVIPGGMVTICGRRVRLILLVSRFREAGIMKCHIGDFVQVAHVLRQYDCLQLFWTRIFICKNEVFYF